MLKAHYDSGVYSTSDGNEYQKTLLGKRRPVLKVDNLTAMFVV
jgi:hypothetical protein